MQIGLIFRGEIIEQRKDASVNTLSVDNKRIAKDEKERGKRERFPNKKSREEVQEKS